MSMNTITPTLCELSSLWTRVLGDPPASSQFELWAEMHSRDTIRHGILKTAAKAQSISSTGGTMSQDHKLRFASKVMNNRTSDPQKIADQCRRETQ